MGEGYNFNKISGIIYIILLTLLLLSSVSCSMYQEEQLFTEEELFNYVSYSSKEFDMRYKRFTNEYGGTSVAVFYDFTFKGDKPIT